MIPSFSPPPSLVTAWLLVRGAGGPVERLGEGHAPPRAPAPRLPVILGRAGSGSARSLCINTGAGENWGQTRKAGEQGRGWGHTDAQPSAAEPRGRGWTRRERRTRRPPPSAFPGGRARLRGGLVSQKGVTARPPCLAWDPDGLGGVSFTVFPGPALPVALGGHSPAPGMAEPPLHASLHSTQQRPPAPGGSGSVPGWLSPKPLHVPRDTWNSCQVSNVSFSRFCLQSGSRQSQSHTPKAISPINLQEGNIGGGFPMLRPGPRP